MCNVQLDKNKYFTGAYSKFGTVPNGVNVPNLPPDLSNHKETCWRWDEFEVDVEIQIPVIDDETGEQRMDENGQPIYETQTVKETRLDWVFDANKHAEILGVINGYIPPKTQEEINAEILAKNEELESTIDTLMTEIIPNLMGLTR